MTAGNRWVGTPIRTRAFVTVSRPNGLCSPSTGLAALLVQQPLSLCVFAPFCEVWMGGRLRVFSGGALICVHLRYLRFLRVEEIVLICVICGHSGWIWIRRRGATPRQVGDSVFSVSLWFFRARAESSEMVTGVDHSFQILIHLTVESGISSVKLTMPPPTSSSMSRTMLEELISAIRPTSTEPFSSFTSTCLPIAARRA